MGSPSETHTAAPHNERPLRVLIVGAGIGGLTAGLALRQAGHSVTILETSKFSNEVGAAIHIAPNCNGILRRLGLNIEDVGANECTGVRIAIPQGKFVADMDLREANKMWQHPWHLVHRAHLHAMLAKHATGEEGIGKPCDLRLSSRVVSVNPEDATVTLESGEQLSADVILGADGVHSICRKFLPGADTVAPYDGGQSAFRFLIPMEQLKNDPLTADIIGRPGTMTLAIAQDRRLVYYPCVKNTVMNCLFLHPSSESRAEGQDWNQKGDKKLLIELSRQFAESFRALIAKAPEDTLKVWTLLDMHELPCWTTGRLALLGDAAHPFLPHQAQGGAQAIEDAASLAAVLPLGTKPTDVQDRLELYQVCRRERATRIQTITRISGMSAEEMKSRGVTYDPVAFNRYNFDHDEWDHSRHMLRQHLWAKSPMRYRQPVSFGPSPGPRQPLNQALGTVSTSRQHQVVHTVRFKTSKTYLRTLLPNKQFSFSGPGTFAQASFVCANLHNLAWLGDTGYSYCALYLHGVRYTKADGSHVDGAFLPLIFEDHPDPIITGREELGAPKLGCTIETSESSPSSRRFTLSWRGTTFGTVEMDDLAPAALGGEEAKVDGGRPLQTTVPEEDTLMWRYVPSVGQPGKADAEYAVLDDHHKAVGGKQQVEDAEPGFLKQRRSELGFGQGSDKLIARSASLYFEPAAWNKLPTVNHVVEVLAEIPVYEVLEAKVEFVPFVRDISQARRVD